MDYFLLEIVQQYKEKWLKFNYHLLRLSLFYNTLFQLREIFKGRVTTLWNLFSRNVLLVTLNSFQVNVWH